MSSSKQTFKRLERKVSTLALALLAALVAGVLTSPLAHATRFANQFVEFELPNRWQCSLEGAEWVCQSTDEQQKRDAIIVLAAKLKGEQDTLIKYHEYLDKSRVFTAPNGKGVSSDPKYTKDLAINGHSWVDSLHLESEIPGFYTRYLATVKDDIGVLVTYSINKTKYQEYLPQFDGMVKSMKVFRKAGGVNTNTGQSLFAQPREGLGSFTQSMFPDQAPSPVAEAKPKTQASSKEEDEMLMLVLVGGVGLVGFIIWKRRRRGV